MSVRSFAAAGLLAGMLSLAAGRAIAAGPAAAREPAAPLPTAPTRGAIVVALDDASAPAARVLARAVYRDAALRPALDEVAAQVLAGDPLPPDAGAAVHELSEVRRSAASAESEPIARRLLASLGASAAAALVVVVASTGGHPTARVLRVAGHVYAPLELGATVQRPVDGAPAFDWPGAAAAIRALLTSSGGEPAAPRTAAGGAVAPFASSASPSPADAGQAPARPLWSSPWFWGPLAGVAAAGIAVFVLAVTSSDDDTVHLRGRIAP